MAAAPSTLSDIFNISLDIAKAQNIFAYYIGALFFLAYFLSIFVSTLHVRQDSVVYPLTRPHLGQDFAEYIIVCKTSLLCGSSFDARGRIIVTLKGSFDDSPPLHLKKGKGIECFFERGSANVFVYHSPSNLGDIEVIDIKLINDAPYEIPYVQWRPSFITVMNPLTREEWGTPGTGRLICPGVLTETMNCIKGKRENHGVFKSLCLFHPLVSLFNSPVRFGMYNNVVNAIFVFFLFSVLISCALVMELALNIMKIKDLTSYDTLYTSDVARAFVCAIFTWFAEILLENLIRNVVPRVSAVRFATFRGLMEPIQSLHTLRDFSIDLDWDTVRPLILNKNVTLVKGSVHLSSHCIFPVAQSLSITNLWGYFSHSEARENDLFVRNMNYCALPLPASLRWLSKEATSLKDEILFIQLEGHFRQPMCVFCCWLRDWPVNFLEEPLLNGLVLSHIISRDILGLMKIHTTNHLARKAQICMHQWYGMICCLFLQMVKQAIFIKSDSTSNINAFIQRTVTHFGKRSPREIQATWRARQQRMKITPWKMMEGAMAGVVDVKEVTDDNVNSISGNALQYIRNAIPWLSPRPSDRIGITDADSFLEDDLRFEDLSDFMYFEEREKRSFDWRVQSGNIQTCGMAAKLEEPSFDLKIEGDKLAEINMVKETEVPMSCMAKPSSRYSPNKLRSRKRSVKVSGPTTNLQRSSTDMDNTNDCCISLDSVHLEMLNENANALELDEEEKQKMKEEIDQQIVMLLQQKQLEKDDTETDDFDQRIASPISEYEEHTLGPCFKEEFKRIPDPDNPTLFLRHKDEMSGYCCGNKQCLAFAEIHRMLGNSAMEILKKILQDLLFFAMDSRIINTGRKMWLRKNMVNKLFDGMDKKCHFYTDEMFKESAIAERENYAVNQSLSTNLTILEVMVDVAISNQNAALEEDTKTREKLYAVKPKPTPRCLFCAKPVYSEFSDPLDGCDNEEKLVKFFIKDTTYVAEQEVNAEIQHKVTLQRFCAGIMNLAVREMLMELEDPPMVLSTKITRAILYKMLEVKSPKASTDFREMSADELRRVGTRRERIQARHDASIGRAKKDTLKQKKDKAINSFLVETLSSKWRVTAKENELQYCAHLLAQCLVQEKILGFSIYSGFISKDHEVLLGGSRAHLIEVEKKATKAILKIGTALLEKRLDQALLERDKIDVVFNKTSVEAGYTLEAVSVMQVLLEPIFLRTCCYYINDIVQHKIAEFVEFFDYIGDFDPLKQLTNIKKMMKETRNKYEMDRRIVEHTVADHGSISTPVLRWGVEAIKGVDPLPEEMLTKLFYEDPEAVLTKAVEIGISTQKLEPLISLLLKTRKKTKRAMEMRENEELKKLQLHLARVQARLTEQVALASQNASDSSAIEIDFQREYHRDELYNIELYATRDLQRPIGTAIGLFLLFVLGLMTLGLMLFTTFRVSNMTLQHATSWFIACGKTTLIYTFALQPLKCLLYSLLKFYRI